jgi:E2F/DP family winged-helix DNA-binding domain/Transcription factor DP
MYNKTLMVSVIDHHKHFPSHIKNLLTDLINGEEVIRALIFYKPYLVSDISLYNIYLKFGYSPEHGNFLGTPNISDLIRYIRHDYQTLVIDIEENCSKSVSILKKEFLRTFYFNDIQLLSNPTELDLTESKDIKDETFEPTWNNYTLCSHQSSILRPPREFSTPRVNKGLKVLSKKIKDILVKNGKASYKVVSDHIVNEMKTYNEIDKDNESDNIRRRIYDSLNVLEASGVVGKAEKNYFWKGFPNIQSEYNESMGSSVANLKFLIEHKRQTLREVCKRYYSLKELITRNSKMDKPAEKIDFPFIIIGTEEHYQNKVSFI